MDESHSPASPKSSSAADGQSPSTPNKRFRTQMSTMQVKVMKSIFQEYKTPTMSECAMLGQEVSLQKRVVQVWFQNARAKEKKARLQLQQLSGVPESEMIPQPPDECKVCSHVYTHKHVIQDHLFSRPHMDAVKVAIEAGKLDPETPGHVLSQAAATLEQQQQQQQQPPPSNSPAPETSALEQAAAPQQQQPQVGPGGGGGGGNGSVEKSLMQQLYGMNHGISSFPSGVATANPFLHPAMFSATGKPRGGGHSLHRSSGASNAQRPSANSKEKADDDAVNDRARARPSVA